MKSIELRFSQLGGTFIDEDTYLVGHQSRLRVDQLYGYRLSLEVFQDIFEFADFAVWRDHVRQEHPEPQAIDAAVHGSIDVVGCHDAGDWNRELLIACAEVPLISWNQAEMSDTSMVADIIG